MQKNIRMFKADWMEWFTHIHPVTPLLTWGPVAAFLFYRAFAVHGLAASEVVGIFFSGLLVWSLAEYSLHRFVFHYEFASHIGKRLHFIIHGVHHDDPEDPTRLVMAPPVALVLALIFYPTFWVLMGVEYADPFFASFVIGYLVYDYTHYAVHHIRPRTVIGRYLKQHHMLHHFAMPDARYGVSSPLWDLVFSSMERKKVPAHH